MTKEEFESTLKAISPEAKEMAAEIQVKMKAMREEFLKTVPLDQVDKVKKLHSIFSFSTVQINLPVSTLLFWLQYMEECYRQMAVIASKYGFSMDMTVEDGIKNTKFKGD